MMQTSAVAAGPAETSRALLITAVVYREVDLAEQVANKASAGPVWSVVLTWNNFLDTDACLRSLAGQTWPDHRIVLVDNGSDDGSFEALRKKWGGAVEIVRNDHNAGVPGGYNRGIRHSLDAGAAIVGLFNNDVIAAPETIERLVLSLRGGEWGAISPVLTGVQPAKAIWFAGIKYHPVLGYTRNLQRGRSACEAGMTQGHVFESDYLPLTACLLTRESIETAGLLDERFFISHEDVEWGLRARRKGIRLGVLAAPLVAHKVSVSVGSAGPDLPSPSLAFWRARGSLLVGALHFRGRSLFPYLLGQFLLCYPYQCLRMARAGRWTSLRAYLRGILDGSKELVAARRGRQVAAAGTEP